jgi:hypothetical protein
VALVTRGEDSTATTDLKPFADPREWARRHKHDSTRHGRQSREICHNTLKIKGLRNRRARPIFSVPGGTFSMSSSLEGRGRLARLRRLPARADLARIVPHLKPGVLQQIVRRQGLEGSAEIVALATSEQLLRVFDVDLWDADEPGGEERFDATRFGRWLEVLHLAGAGVAAGKIAAMDFDFVAASLAEHVVVLDGTWLPLDAAGDERDAGAGESPREGPAARLAELIEGEEAHELGGYRVFARSGRSWDALLTLLVDLDASHPAFFGRLMRHLARVSTEILDDELFEFLPGAGETAAGDLAAGREERREAEGYVTPVMAAAFLSSACGLRLHTMPSPPAWDPVTAVWFRGAERRARERGEGRADPGREPGSRAAAASAPARDFVGGGATPREAGPRPKATPRLGPARDTGDRLRRIRERVRYLEEHDVALHARRMQELGYVGNVLVAGASFGGHRFRAAEAAAAAAAVCNLGLENWPRAWLPGGRSGPPVDFLLRQDLVTVFRVGWSVLHESVSLQTARTLVEILSRLVSDDGALHEQLAGLRDGLRRQVEAGTPWRELDNLDVLLALDPPSWSVLVGLLDRCPVASGATRSDFEFIAENRQVECVREFLRSLPDRLSDHGRHDPAPRGGFPRRPAPSSARRASGGRRSCGRRTSRRTNRR